MNEMSIGWDDALTQWVEDYTVEDLEHCCDCSPDECRPGLEMGTCLEHEDEED